MKLFGLGNYMNKNFIRTYVVSVFFFVVVLMGTTFFSHAAGNGEAALYKPKEFHEALNSGFINYSKGNKISHIVFLRSGEVPNFKLPSKAVGQNVNAYYDSSKGTVYIYSSSNKIYFSDDISNPGLFRDFYHLETIEFGDKIDTSRLKSMESMFVSDYRLKSVDLSGFSTNNVEYMNFLFYGCCNLETVKFGTNFSTANVTDMDGMFQDCASLMTVDLSMFNTSSCTEFRQMFLGCEKLRNIDVSSFNTQNAKKIDSMFSECKTLKDIDISSFDLSNIESANYLFENCFKLRTVKMCKPGNYRPKGMSYVFNYCENIISVDMSSFDFSKVTPDSFNLLYGNPKLKEFISPKNINYEYGLNRKFYRDDNSNGIPDTPIVYEKIHKDKYSHRYIYVENPAVFDDPNGTHTDNPINFDVSASSDNRASDTASNQAKGAASAALPTTVTANDITYSISADGKATVTKIGDVKKASINEVVYSGVKYPVTTIAANAAKGNKKLTAVTIGSNVTKIDKKAFYNCKNLKKVTIKANKTISVSSSAFKKINKKASVSVKGIKGKTKKKLVDALKKQIGK